MATRGKNPKKGPTKNAEEPLDAKAVEMQEAAEKAVEGIPNVGICASGALRTSEEWRRTILRMAMDGFWLADMEGRLLEVNEAYCQMSGFREQELLAMCIFDLEVVETAAGVAAHIHKVMTQGEDRFESRHRRKDGSILDVEVGVRYLHAYGGRLVCFLRDITERKRAEDERKAHIHFLESLERVDRAIKQETDVEQMLWRIINTVFSIFDCDRAWLLWPCDPDAPSFRVPVEITKPEFPGAKVLNVDVPMSPGEARCMREALESDAPVTYTAGTERLISTAKQFGVQSQMFVPLYPKIGKPWVFGIHQCSFPRIWTKEEIRLFKEISRRISDGLSSVLILRELQENEERFRGTFEQAAVGIAHVDQNGRWLRVNKKLCNIVGYSREELLQKTFQDITHSDDIDAGLEYLRDVLAGEIPTYSAEERYLRKDGSIVWIDLTVSFTRHASGDPGYFIFVIEDITGRKRAEEEKVNLEGQLQHAQKMESVGRLAGGVAHDFNNMLTVVLGHVELILEHVDQAEPLHDDLEAIRTAAERSANLTRQLLTFARKQKVSPKVLDLNETVAGMLKMLQRLIGENFNLNWHPSPNLWPVNMDPSQIDQILVNLCVNARDAIADVGKITIETGNSTFDEEYCADHAGFVPGEYVRISVSDNGCGMDQEILAHIFEPFFTTKDVGKGTGLGLATVYGAVKQNNGFINAYSEPGQGTTFTIYLPRHVGKTMPSPTQGAAGMAVRGHETILLVEDEPAILKLTQMLLKNQGYTVLAAPTPGEALRLAAEHTGELHLLMADVVMPEMNGRDLAKKMLAIYPRLKRLFMSGYSADVIAQHDVQDKGVHFIQKPFSIQSLASKIREALEQ